ncbi:MAG: enoyl-[acyl-carrier-protein] reductase FabL [Anaerolineae bacterium]
MSTFPLLDKVALVTGGSRGIGRGIALELARRGADVVVNYARKQRAAEGVVAEVEKLGRRGLAIKANLAEADKIEAMFARIEAEFGRCDILVGNAASGVLKPLAEITDKHWDWTMDVNARSILRCAQRALPHMKRQSWGRIIAITSMGSVRVYPAYTVVGISKAAIEALTRYLAAELAPHGIVVNAIAPGLVDTDALGHFPLDPAEAIRVSVERTPAGRLVTPADIGRLVAFLCTDDAAMIVGQTIVMDGGFSLMA